MPYLTPDTIPATVTCRNISIPDDIRVIAAVSGALLELTYEHNWEAYGAVTPYAIAAAMVDVVYSFLNSNCEAFMPDESLWIHQEAQGTNGGGITANTDTICPFPVEQPTYPAWIEWNTGNTLRIQAGQYRLRAWHYINPSSAVSRMWFAHNNGASILVEGLVRGTPSGAHAVLQADGFFTLAAETICAMYSRTTVTVANTYFGRPYNQAGRPEIYGALSIVRLGDYTP